MKADSTVKVSVSIRLPALIHAALHIVKAHTGDKIKDQIEAAILLYLNNVAEQQPDYGIPLKIITTHSDGKKGTNQTKGKQPTKK